MFADSEIAPMQNTESFQTIEPPPAQLPANADITAIVKQYAPLVYRTCFAVTRNSHDAEDASQTTFITLAEQIAQGTQIRHLPAWLQQVAHRTSLDLYRSRTRRRRREDYVRSNSPTETAAVFSADRAELAEAIQKELHALPTTYRTPLILHYFGDLSSTQIARQLGCNAKALSMRLLRGRRMLAERLADRGFVMGSTAMSLLLAEVVRNQICAHAVPAPVALPPMSAAILARFDHSATSELFLSLLRGIAARPRRAMFAAALFAGSALGGRTVDISHITRQLRDGVPSIESVQSILKQLLRRMPTPQVNLRPQLSEASQSPTLGEPSVAVVPPMRLIWREPRLPNQSHDWNGVNLAPREIVFSFNQMPPAMNDALAGNTTASQQAPLPPTVESRHTPGAFAAAPVARPSNERAERFSAAVIAAAVEAPAVDVPLVDEVLSETPADDPAATTSPVDSMAAVPVRDGIALAGQFAAGTTRYADANYSATDSALSTPINGGLTATGTATPNIPEPTTLAPLAAVVIFVLQRRHH